VSGATLLKSKSVVPGDPAASELVRRLKGLGDKPAMPMGFPPLSKADIAKVERWIAEGATLDNAVAPKHWAYVAPVRPAVPDLKSTWVRNPVDAFVLQRLKKEGLSPSPTASRETLLRRVTLDLTGLPPTPVEIDAFLADKRPDAYERAVDRLLASPQYGVKQARGWLDLARYADTNGYEKDVRRTAWLYRDWVVNAFNANMPYDRFTIEQLAGDLLPNATLDDKVATGFNRNSMFNEEGGVDQEEAHFNVILDRVDTTATVWLGSTLACARCHDHKYDPFSQKDYYKMAAFYSNTTVYPRGPKEVGEEKWFEAEVPIRTSEFVLKESALKAKIAAANTELSRPTPERIAAFGRWEESARILPVWAPARPSTATAKGDGGVGGNPQMETLADGSVRAGGPNPDRATYVLELPASAELTTGLQLEVIPDEALPNRGPGRAPNGNFVLSQMIVEADGKPVGLASSMADFVQNTHNIEELLTKHAEKGWAVHPSLGKPHRMTVALATPVEAGRPIRVTLACVSDPPLHTLGRFRISRTSAPAPFAGYVPDEVRSYWKKPVTSGPNPAWDYFVSIDPAAREPRLKLKALEAELQSLQAQVPTALIMEEKPAKGPLTAFVRHRGEFLTKAEEVTADTPTILPKLNKARANRLDLANWIVSPSNPLTARVQVNRMWEGIFGTGLVETTEDLGTRGNKPTHPQLLDWLATEFMAKGWDMKAMTKLIVTSNTYRQSSNATPKLLEKDPTNLLLARGPRFRLEAETIRDSLLASSGLLSRKTGGPSVFPYQPEGAWNNPYNGELWMRSEGDDRYRRSLYTFWKRTSPYPAYMAFDATSREICTVRRIRTNTPLQALTLLNDQEMMEAASALGQRMRSTKGDVSAQISAGFRLCTGRAAKPSERERLTALLTKLRQRYEAKPEDVKKLGTGSPEDAAWTMVGNVLLNLDETITKE
ncbi:DUF1553 domain-containing protein, partial [bacterium]